MRPVVVSAVVMAFALAACAGKSAPPSASSGASGPAGETYTTTAFSVPLTVHVGPLLKRPPTSDEANLLSWDAAASDNEKVRFLIPVEFYPPGSLAPQAPPADYLDYLQTQTNQFATISEVSTITVDGHPASLLTATTTKSLDGSLGCPVNGADQADGCFGLQPEFALRIAVIELGGGKMLLAWARTGSDAADKAFVTMFEVMLASIRFTTT